MFDRQRILIGKRHVFSAVRHSKEAGKRFEPRSHSLGELFYFSVYPLALSATAQRPRSLAEWEGRCVVSKRVYPLAFLINVINSLNKYFASEFFSTFFVNRNVEINNTPRPTRLRAMRQPQCGKLK